MMTTTKQFEELIGQRSDSDCWWWLGKLNPSGFPMILIEGKWRKAATYSYESFKGPVPAGEFIRYPCDNKLCVNPDHLHVVRSLPAHQRPYFEYKGYQVPAWCAHNHVLWHRFECVYIDKSESKKKGHWRCRRCTYNQIAEYQNRKKDPESWRAKVRAYRESL